MELIQNSRDLLNIVLAFCILWLTIFIAWFIYYLAMIMRQVYLASRGARDVVQKAGEAVKLLKEKIEHSASYLPLIVEGVKKIVEVMKEKKERKKK